MTEVQMTGNPTLTEIRTFLNAHIREGVKCPGCRQFAKIYRRPLTRAMAIFLVRAYRIQQMEWFHVQDFVEADPRVPRTVAGDFAKLKHWGLIEEEQIRRPDGGRAGWWRLTQKGMRFALRQIKVPKYALLYDNHLIDFEEPEIDIEDALTVNFNYTELMYG